MQIVFAPGNIPYNHNITSGLSLTKHQIARAFSQITKLKPTKRGGQILQSLRVLCQPPRNRHRVNGWHVRRSGRFCYIWHDFWRIDGRRIQCETINGSLLNGLSGAKVNLPEGDVGLYLTKINTMAWVLTKEGKGGKITVPMSQLEDLNRPELKEVK